MLLPLCDHGAAITEPPPAPGPGMPTLRLRSRAGRSIPAAVLCAEPYMCGVPPTDAAAAAGASCTCVGVAADASGPMGIDMARTLPSPDVMATPNSASNGLPDDGGVHGGSAGGVATASGAAAVTEGSPAARAPPATGGVRSSGAGVADGVGAMPYTGGHWCGGVCCWPNCQGAVWRAACLRMALRLAARW